MINLYSNSSQLCRQNMTSMLNFSYNILVITSKLPHSITCLYHKIVNFVHPVVAALHTVHICNHLDSEPDVAHESICTLVFQYCRSIIK